MVKKFADLGIGQQQEPDRFQVDKRGAMQIFKYRIDEKTKWFEVGNPSKRGILKFDGIDIATGEKVKYFTTSQVLIKMMDDMSDLVGTKITQDEQKIAWFTFNEPVEIGGIEMVSTGIKGHNPYPKFI